MNAITKENEMEECKKEKGFTTLDSYLSGFLVLQGFNPELVDKGRKVVFEFEKSDALFDSLADYNSGAMVEAAKLVIAIKMLKTRIFSMKD